MGECLPFPLEPTAGATAGDEPQAQGIMGLFYTGSCDVPLEGSVPCARALPFDIPSFSPLGTASQPVVRVAKGKPDESLKRPLSS